MKAKHVMSMAVVAGILALLPAAVLCQEKVTATQWTQIVEQIGDKGRINWSEGYIEAVGIGAPPERAYGKANARPMAMRAAKLDAYRNLLEVTKGVRVDSSTTIRDFAVESDVINTQVAGFVNGAQQVGEPNYLSDGTVEVTVRMPIGGGFRQLIIPKIMEKGALKPVAAEPVPAEPAAPPAAPAPAAPAGEAVAPPPAPPAPAVTYTGLVVDARGIQARPAMSPRILDEQGGEVYGTASVERDYAVQQGMSGYARDLTAAQSNSRVTNNPFSVKGLKTLGAGRSDIVISDSDARSLRANAENASALKKCRVMIVLD